MYDVWPVAVIAPMAFGNPNTILGGDLRELLALGCRTGYFYLERLAYGWGGRETIASLQAGTLPDDAGEAAVLRYLDEQPDLRPWRDDRRRLGELDAAYRPNLQLPHGT